MAMVCCILLTALCIPSLTNAGGPEENSLDPSQIRRMLISPERVPEVLAGVKKGVLVQLPRQEFEEKVRRALLPLESAKNPPRLVEARYRAALMSASLVGTAQWKMINPVSVAGMLALQPFNLALVKANLRKGHLDTTEAVLGELDGKSLGLLLEHSGEQIADLNWSARGELGPGGLHFDLQIPPCPVASLELDLPAEMIVMPSGRESHLLSGPFPPSSLPPGGGGNEAVSRKLWRIEFGGQSKVDLILRPRADLEGRHPPLILAQVENAYQFSPGLVQADFEFRLEMPHHRLHQPLEFELDADLRPIEVSVSNLETWENPSPSKLVVRLKEPFQGGSLLIRCLARLGPDKVWNCPSCHLRGAVLRGETIIFRIPANIQLENWQSGDFRLTGSDSLADGGHILSLAATNLYERGNPKKPRAQIGIPGPKYRVKQLTWLQVGTKQSVLTAQFLYEIVTGQLFRLPLILPDGWEVDKVDLFPAALLRNWTVASDQGQRTLLVELQRPLTSSFISIGPIPKLSPRLSVWLRPTLAEIPLNTSAALPDIVPRGAEFREGHLAISVDPILQAQVKASVAHIKCEEKGPWGRQNPDFYFPFQGGAVEGTLFLQRRQPRITARCHSQVVITPRSLVMAIRLSLQPRVEGTDSIALSLSAPVPSLSNWQTREGSIRVRQARRLWQAELATSLAAFGTPTVLHQLNYLASQASLGQLWLLTFDRPLSEPITLETTVDIAATPAPSAVTERKEGGGRPEFALPKAEQYWEVPIPIVIGADSMEGDLTLRRAGAEQLEVETKGMQSSGEATVPETGSLWKTFHYGPRSVSLKLRSKAPKATAELNANPARADHVRMTTRLESTARLVNYFSFRLVNWPQPTLPVRLPEGARPVGATVNGSWIPQLRWEETSEGKVLLELPVIAGQNPDYEIVYFTDGPGWGLWSRVKTPLPDLPMQRVLGWRRSWCLPPGLAPLDQGRLQALTETSPFRSFPSGADRGWANWPRIPFQVMPLSLSDGDEWVNSQRRVMTEAGIRLRHDLENERSITLAEGLERLAFDFLKDSLPLVLDVRAFREINLTPTRPFVSAFNPGENRSSFPWEALGIVYVPCKPAALLTSRSQQQAWNAERQINGLSKALTSAIAEAAVHGHDSSGRFQTVADWIPRDFAAEDSSLENRGSRIEKGQSLLRSSMLEPPPSSLEPGWTEWEYLAGPDANEGLVLVRRDVLIELSFFLSLMFLLVIWWIRKSATWIAWLVLLIWLAGGSLAAIWLPAPLDELAKWPALTGWIIALLRFLKWSVSTTPSAATSGGEPRWGLGGLAAIGSAVLGLLAIPGHAGAPQPATVYIVPGPAEAPANQIVLVSPEILDKLRDLGEGVLSPRRKPILISARYHGTVAKEIADFTADFQIHSFGDGPFQFTIPLSPITLREALLDGAAANPIVTPVNAGRSLEGYSLQIRHGGTHSIRFHFTAPVRAAGDITEVQLRIPELAMSRLTLEMPTGSTSPYVLGAKGAQRVIPTTTSSKEKRFRLEADLGQINTLRVHWRPDNPNAGTVRVREAYFWDLRHSSPSLFAYLRYTISQGDVTNLVLNVPEQLEVRNDPVVARDPTDNSQESPPRLKDWYWTGTGPQRRLVVEFVRPVRGTAQLTLELVPSAPFGPELDLPLPTPQGVQLSPGKGTEHLLAFRSQGLESQLVANLRVTGVEQDTFRNWWASSGLADPGSDFHAFGFQREPGGPPVLRLKLTPSIIAPTGSLNVNWRLRKNQAELQATAELHSSTAEIGLVEWEVPPEISIISVSGPQVRSWSRTGSRLQIWLTGLVAEAKLRLTGWMPLGPDKEARRFRLLPVRVTPVQGLTEYVRVEADKDLALEPIGLTKLLPLPSSVASEREFSYVVDQDGYGGEFRVRSSPPAAVQGSPLPARSGGQPDHRPNQAQKPDLHPRVLLADQEAAVLDGRHWEYQASYWISPGLGNDLTFRLPEGATILEAAVNEMRVSPLPLAAGRLWLPLAGNLAAPILRLRWTYEDAYFPAGRPILESPHLERLPDFPMLWTVHVPPGYAVARLRDPTQEVSAGGKFLHAAESQLQLSLLLIKRASGRDHLEISSQLRAAQERFYRYCGLAEHWLKLTKASDAVLQDIRERNRKQISSQGFEKIRQRAEQEAKRDPLGLGGVTDNEPLTFLTGSLTDQGTPTYWFVTPGAPPPHLDLTTYSQRRFSLAARATVLIMAVLLAVIALAWIPKTRRLLRDLGPEIIVLLGCLGWSWAGPDWFYVGLIGLGVFGRLFWLIRKWTNLANSPGKEPAPITRKADRSTPPSLAGS